MRRYFVVSDLHLADFEDHADGWKAHKRSDRSFDGELAAELRAFVEDGSKDDLTLVLNGDIIDFDLVTRVPDDPPFPVNHGERLRGLEPTAAKAVWKLRYILADHPIFVEMLVDFIVRGHQVVYVIGNHDPELWFPEVQEAFIDILARSAGERPFAPERMRFERWFFYVPGEIYAEHGHQYDYYTSFRYPLKPVVPSEEGPTIALPMGNISNRYLMNRMGFFNPHASDYILNVYKYVEHWLTHYAFTRRGIILPWFIGSLMVLARLIRTKNATRVHAGDYRKLLREEAERKGLPEATIVQLDRLKRPPIAGRLYRMIREFWIDRVLLAAGMTGGTIVLGMSSAPPLVKLMVPLTGFPLLYFIYEMLAHNEGIFSFEREAHKQAKKVAALLPAALVTFGHSHKPELIPLGRQQVYVNTGTWAPTQGSTPAPGLRNVVILECDGRRHTVRFDSRVADWLDDSPSVELEPREDDWDESENNEEARPVRSLTA